MLAVAFDTLKLARKLESAGMPSKQAQDTSAALSETYTEWLSLGNVATREDVQKVEAKIDKVEAKIDNVEARLGTKIAETKATILYWMLGQTFALAALVGLTHYLH